MKSSLLETLAARNLRALVGGATSLPHDVHAYRHANGFDKLTISPPGASITVRAHFWHPREQGEVATKSVHNHRWDFCSRVLQGAINIRVLAPDPEGDQYQHYEYRPGTSDDVSFADQVGLSVVRRHAYESGDFYFEDHELIHLAEPTPRSSAITVVAHGPVKKEAADVFTERGGSPALGERAETLSKEVLLDHLQSLARLVDRLGNADSAIGTR